MRVMRTAVALFAVALFVVVAWIAGATVAPRERQGGDDGNTGGWNLVGKFPSCSDTTFDGMPC